MNKNSITLINEKLTDNQSADLTEQLPDIFSDPLIHHTSIFINGLEKYSAPDDSSVSPIIDTPTYNNQSDECLRFSRLHSKSTFHIKIAKHVATKEFLIDEICSLKSEVTYKQQMDKMMANFGNTNLLT